jgi:hypothetical protein
MRNNPLLSGDFVSKTVLESPIEANGHEIHPELSLKADLARPSGDAFGRVGATFTTHFRHSASIPKRPTPEGRCRNPWPEHLAAVPVEVRFALGS